VFHELVKRLLSDESDIEIIGDAEGGREGLIKIEELHPDLVLMDIGMPDMNGITVTNMITARMPDVKVIVLTVFDVEEYRKAAKASGAYGYIVKKNLVQELVPAIRSLF
jgi:DNA-binding NarL/FixJ family response regulator